MKAVVIGFAGLSLIGMFTLGWHWPVVDIRSGQSEIPEAVSFINTPLPDFSQYTDVKQKKLDFFNYLLPIIKHENQNILKEREWLLAHSNQSDETSQAQMNRILQLADKYDVSTLDPNKVLSELLQRVDIIPPSLALAQAANESAWGTSRFAKQGNNLFGQWCYVRGCGLVPLQQQAGQHYEVARYENIQQSVASYMRNLNSQFSYSDLRNLRQTLRKQGQIVSGLTLAEGLESYSTRRGQYVKEIQAMILHNQLGQYDI